MADGRSPRSSKDSASLASIEPLLAEESSGSESSEEYSEKPTSEHRPEDCFDFLFIDNVVSHSLHTCWEHMRPFILFLVPSFLHRYFALIDESARPPNLHAVASLDGIRGFASLGIFILHFTDTYCSHRVNYGFGVDPDNRWWFQIPFIRVFWTGNSLVACFFVISGYVLSHKPLKQMRSRSDAPLLQTLSSAVFRRGLRLYLPITAATFIAMLLVRIGAFDIGHRVFHDGHSMTATENTPPYLPTFGEQISHWLQTMKDMTYPWHFGSVQSIYDPHLWTVPMEYQGSMVLYLVLICVSGLHTAVRLGIALLIIAYCLYTSMMDYMMFFIGMVLAEVDMILQIDTPPAPMLELSTGLPDRRRWIRLRRIALCITFAFGVYLMGTPVWNAVNTPGYQTLVWILSSEWYCQKLGCILVIVSVRHSPQSAVLFTNSFAQYLGRASFALYIVHGNVRRIILYAMMPWVWSIVGGKENQWSFGAAVLIGMIVTWPITFWCADVFMRGIDEPSVRFARWLEGKARRRD
ncbi:MAG: hypothetical protein M1836_005482 [Candelina mexicana]|nr:MAG: hypothetical protein M1836_005482 [Candelina mexicana]